MGQKYFFGKVKPISREFRDRMVGVSWREGCPIGLDMLRQIELNHWTPSGRIETGSLIVHKDVADELLEIFEYLFNQRFPLHSVKPIFWFGGDDSRSMQANNTSAFNCRPITGRSKGYSVHSYGKAIDINPLWNPYVRRKQVLPHNGREFVKRSPCLVGMICPRSDVLALFISRGWTWGGAWKSLKDYQHFQKR
tara:strand:+ start:148 stop:729 length:582 start_codon:yes stop_codon:yes gene_type:complete